MPRRFLCILLCLCLFSAGAHADFETVPTRSIFSLAYDRLQTAIKRNRAVSWSMSIVPTQVRGFSGHSLEALSALFHEMEIAGQIHPASQGGYVDASLLVDGHEVISFGQTVQDGYTGLNLGDGWIVFPTGSEQDVAALLSLDALGMELLDMDYEQIRAGSIPFLTSMNASGIRLWSLASPFSETNNHRSVPSGATSHATDYELDTYALRSVLGNWVDELSMGDLTLGLPGTAFSLGVSEEAYDAFVEKLRSFTQTVELSKPLKFGLAFGEGDILCSANGRGTLREDSGTRNISYTYRCDLGKKEISGSVQLDFRPREWDTLVLNGSWSTKSNGRSTASDKMSFTASGEYDGLPYYIKIKSNMANQYTLDDNSLLTEGISGTFYALVEYDDATVGELTITREGATKSYPGLTSALRIEDTYNVSLRDAEGIVFEGDITLSFYVSHGATELPDVLTDAYSLEALTADEIAALQESVTGAYAKARQRFVQMMPTSALTTLIRAY